MLTSHDLIAFVATVRPDDAKAFYGGVLGLRLVEDSPFALVFDAAGTMLRVQKVRELAPAPHTALGWRVADIRSEVEALAARGVTFERYPGLAQDGLGIWTSPAGGRIAWFRDPDGNVLSLTQF